ncbi:hypothetical protein BDR26DRAFT_852503 [Obelidium mucronatum]|nr:hypothetical protein BDR26DRAFT_852503 [Obelidium mucronatum]
MTIETCSKLAASQGFPLFGLEYGYECFAGYSYAYSPSPSTGCNMNCEGNNSEICGGGNAISVYTASSFRFAGCFSDDANSRVLPNLIGNSVGMTVEACAQLARVWGFSMFGLEAGKECWAGNAYEYYPKSSDQCVAACTGQNGQLCGGWGSISVYYV